MSDLQKGFGNGPNSVNATEGPLEVVCGPLLNFKRLEYPDSSSPSWHGSVLVVTKPSQSAPTLQLTKGSDKGAPTKVRVNSDTGVGISRSFDGLCLYSDPQKSFWRFLIDVQLGSQEQAWTYEISGIRSTSNSLSSPNSSYTFFVPSATQSMRIMFHSCNGFSVGTDVDAYSGPALWNDVNRVHNEKPFHVMIGGGDQIYNDGVRVKGPLSKWTVIKNPRKRREYPFDESLRSRCDQFYYDNYVSWYGSKPFSVANSVIPQINVWDDHDIIDGFGSYTDHFMKCAVFRGIGGISFKYYCLFQHHVPPPKSTFTTSTPQTMNGEGLSGPGADPTQLKDTFVIAEDPDTSYIVGKRPGPYVEEHSRSLYMRLGRSIAFIGVDARTERTRHQVNYPETYNLIFDRAKREIQAARGDVKHLILLLGVPIAYPRLAWLENIIKSPLIAPLRLLNRRFGFAGGLFNKFDGEVDLLDDLDDHYTARQHKHERKELILRLQHFAKEFNVRVSILGGDVHLAAIGRFYSNPKLRIPAESDPRYMANIISSAITNKPPPVAIANLLARRNKIHHLDHDTDETMMNLFDQDPGNSNKTANANHCTMPSRNYAIITEHALQSDSASRPTAIPSAHVGNDGHKALHVGEDQAGTTHAFAVDSGSGEFPGGLDVCIRVEIDQHDREGKTHGYGFSIPPLNTTSKHEITVNGGVNGAGPAV